MSVKCELCKNEGVYWERVPQPSFNKDLPWYAQPFITPTGKQVICSCEKGQEIRREQYDMWDKFNG